MNGFNVTGILLSAGCLVLDVYKGVDLSLQQGLRLRRFCFVYLTPTGEDDRQEMP